MRLNAIIRHCLNEERVLLKSRSAASLAKNRLNLTLERHLELQVTYAVHQQTIRNTLRQAVLADSYQA